MAFRDGASDDWGWSGAMLITDTMDDLAIVRSFCEGTAGLKPHQKKK